MSGANPWPDSENLTDAEVIALAAQDQDDAKWRGIDVLTDFRRLKGKPPGDGGGTAGVREPARPRTPPGHLEAAAEGDAEADARPGQEL